MSIKNNRLSIPNLYQWMQGSSLPTEIGLADADDVIYVDISNIAHWLGKQFWKPGEKDWQLHDQIYKNPIPPFTRSLFEYPMSSWLRGKSGVVRVAVSGYDGAGEETGHDWRWLVNYN